jgi:hypothetical protein
MGEVTVDVRALGLLLPAVVADVDVALLELLVEAGDLVVAELEASTSSLSSEISTQPVSAPLSRRAVIWSALIARISPFAVPR